MKNSTRPICQIAAEIRADWGDKIYFGAKPYLSAMLNLRNIDDQYGCETAKTQIIYFLANATTWQGEKARAIKKELNQLCK